MVGGGGDIKKNSMIFTVLFYIHNCNIYQYILVRLIYIDTIAKCLFYKNIIDVIYIYVFIEHLLFLQHV